MRRDESGKKRWEKGSCQGGQRASAAGYDPASVAIPNVPEGQRVGPMVPRANRERARRHAQDDDRGNDVSSAVRRLASFASALRSVGLNVRIPKRAKVALIRFMSRVHSPTRFSRSRFGRLASSSPIVGIAAMLQYFGALGAAGSRRGAAFHLQRL
jgi:hypothetical protein